jgi:sarcosine oxidase subunit beta
LQPAESSFRVASIVPSPAAVDVAVVGAGVIGLAVARELTGHGCRTAVVERVGIAAGASGVQPGGVRQQWGTRIACRLARESVGFWADVTDRLESPVPLVLRRCGYLFAARSEALLARLADNVRLQNEEDVPSRVVSAAEAAELVPGLASGGLAGGAWCEEDGYFDRPQAVVEAFARGVEVRITSLEALEQRGAGWSLRLADGERLAASMVVVAAGVDSTALLAPLGVELPIVAEERYLFMSEPVSERLLEPLVVAAELGLAAKQLADGRVLASDLSARGDEAAGRERWRANVRKGVEALLPQLVYVSLPLLVRGTYDVTPDHQPVLGPVPGHDGLHVAAGFSGHGFMIAPAVARIVAAAVTGTRDEALDVLGVERFAEGRLVPEPQFV